MRRPRKFEEISLLVLTLLSNVKTNLSERFFQLAFMNFTLLSNVWNFIIFFFSIFSKKIIKSEHLKLAVEVLTSKTCSEEGLEDVTALLLNLSGPEVTRDTILSLLLQGKFGKNSDKTHSFYHQSLFLLSKIVKS